MQYFEQLQVTGPLLAMVKLRFMKLLLVVFMFEMD